MPRCRFPGLWIFTALIAGWSPLHGQEDGRKSIHQIQAEEHSGLVVHAEPGMTRPQPLAPQAVSNVTRTVFGFYPYWAPGFSQIRFQDLTHLAVFSVEANGTGNLVNLRGWPNVPLIEAAHRANVRVILVCTLFNSGALQSLLADPGARQTLISNLKDQVLRGGADGVNIDFEGVPASQRQNLVAFMKELALTIKSAVPGAHISIDSPAVDWSNAWDYASLADVCDALMIMAYDYHWSGSKNPGPISPLSGSDLWGKYSLSWTVGDYLNKVGAQRSKKLIMGVPYYGYDWPAESDALNARALKEAVSKTYAAASAEAAAYGRRWDGFSATPWYYYESQSPHQVWYEDASSLSLKYDLVFQNDLQGIGIWALTYDRERNELWRLIEDRFGVQLPPDPPAVTAPSVFFDTRGLPLALSAQGSIPATDYQIAVGTTPGGKEVSDFKSVGLRTQIWIKGLSLIAGSTYYITARSLGQAGAPGSPSAPVAVRIDTSRPPSRRYLPRWVSSAELYTGLALVNLSLETSCALIRARVKGQDNSIETSWVLHPGQQLAQLTSQPDLLGPETTNKEGWLEIVYLGDQIRSMYLTGDTQVSRSLVGSPLLHAVVKQVLPELDEGRALISLANPSDQSAAVRLRLLRSDGGSETQSIRLAPNEMLHKGLSELFPTLGNPGLRVSPERNAPVRSPFIVLDSDSPIVCSSTLTRGQDSAAVPAVDSSRALKAGAFSFVISGSGYRSQAVLANLSAEQQTVECRLLGAGETAPAVIAIPPMAAIMSDIAELFGLGSSKPLQALVQGSILVSVTQGSGVLGSVWLRTEDHRVMAALPLAPLESSSFSFPQLAQAKSYWTGVSISNPGSVPVTAAVEALDAWGNSLGSHVLPLSPGEARTGLLWQWLPSTLGVLSGRVDVRGSGLLLAAQIFGSDALSFMAAVPGR